MVLTAAHAPANSRVATPWLPNGSVMDQDFGVPEYLPQFGINGTHEGVDLGGRTGDPVVLPAAIGHASVAGAGWDRYGGGNFVKLALDDGTTVDLFHLNDTAVKAGQDVTGGTLLGHLGSTGNSTGPHLHFQVNQGGTPVDPWHWITELPVVGGIAGGAEQAGSTLRNVNDFFGILTKPENWWRALFIAAGAVMITIGVVTYFFKEERGTVVTVVHEAEQAAPAVAEAAA